MLLAVTPQPLDWPGDALAVRRLNVGDWHVLAVTDAMSRVAATSVGIEVSHAPAHLLQQPLVGRGVFVNVDAAARRVTLHRTVDSGSYLYYTITARGELMCASRISELRAAGVNIEENREHLPEWFVHCLLTPPTTLFRGIFALPRGSRLTFDITSTGCVLRSDEAWAAPHPGDMPFEIAAEHCREALEAAVARAGDLDERATILLSGGVDSSLLATMAQRRGFAHTTYSTSYSFEQPERDIEKQYALSAAEALHLYHRHLIPTTEQYLAGVVHAIEALETPIHGLQTVLLSCLMRDGLPPQVRLIFNGEGADGVFGLPIQKYVVDHQRAIPLERWLTRPAVVDLLWRVNYWTKIGGSLAEELMHRRGLIVPLEDPTHHLWSEHCYGNVEWTCRHFGVTPMDCHRTRLQTLHRHAQLPFLQRVSTLSLNDIDGLQTSWGRLAHAAGRTMWYPFTDREAIAAVSQMSWSDRLRELKVTLRRIGRSIGVPEFILTRPKAAFGIQPDRWALPGGVLEPLIALAAPEIDPRLIPPLQVNHDATSRIYWNLVNYGIWKRLIIRGQSRQTLLDELQEALQRQNAMAA